MSLNIKNPETHRLAREVAARTGESLTTAVTESLRQRLAGLPGHNPDPGAIAAIREVQALIAALPDRDTRSAEEILGYDEAGLPT